MGYLAIELARTIDEERTREAERCHLINKTLRTRQKHAAHPAEILVHWLHSVKQQKQRVATEPAS